MLTRLLPDQISKFWDIIKFAVEQSLPPLVGDLPDKMNRILSAALSGRVDVWASYTRDEEERTKINAILLTKFIYDDASDTRNLLLYCLYGYEEIKLQSWIDGLDKVSKYAKYHKCSQIVAYTSLTHLIELAEKLGGEADYTFISLNADKIIQNLNDLNGGQSENNN